MNLPKPRAKMTAMDAERLRGMASAAAAVLRAIDDELADRTSVRGWSAAANEGADPSAVVTKALGELGLTLGHLDLVERKLIALAGCFSDP
jgi:hypothetical protein